MSAVQPAAPRYKTEPRVLPIDESMSEVSVVAVGAAAPPVALASIVLLPILAKLIVPVDVIVPPVRPVPVATLVTVPVLAATHEVLVPSVCSTFPECVAWVGKRAFKAAFGVVCPVPPLLIGTVLSVTEFDPADDVTSPVRAGSLAVGRVPLDKSEALVVPTTAHAAPVSR